MHPTTDHRLFAVGVEEEVVHPRHVLPVGLVRDAELELEVTVQRGHVEGLARGRLAPSPEVLEPERRGATAPARSASSA